MAAVRLSPWGQGIHPHERTRKADIADRLQLTRAMRANLSPVFGLYQDTDGQIAQLLTPESPLLKDVHVDGVQHTFWRIGDGERVGALGALLADRDIVIADGHHRYETALAYQAECRATARGSVPPGPHDYVLMYLTDALSPDLVILPTHRIVKRESVDQEQLLHALASEFDLYSLGDSSDLAAALGGYADGRVAMAMLTRDMGAFVLRLKTRPALPQRPGSEHALLSDLDVAVLQDRVLAPLLGISRETLAASGAVTYTIDAQVAAQAVREGGAQLAFILNPTSMDQVWNAATAGLAMPQKSTYFYPKLLTGLVINPLTCDK